MDSRRKASAALLLLLLLSSPRMKQYSSELKHYVLTQHASNPSVHSFSSLAASLGGGVYPSTISRWHSHWDGTQLSLERREGSGRPRLLSRRETNNLIRLPIMNANRSHHAVHYTDLLHTLRKKTGKKVAIRTLRRYGKKDYGS